MSFPKPPDRKHLDAIQMSCALKRLFLREGGPYQACREALLENPSGSEVPLRTSELVDRLDLWLQCLKKVAKVPLNEDEHIKIREAAKREIISGSDTLTDIRATLEKCRDLEFANGNHPPLPKGWIDPDHPEWWRAAALYLFTKELSHVQSFPIATVHGDSAAILRVTIETYPGEVADGEPRAALHPRSAIRWDLDPEFHESLGAALEAASKNFQTTDRSFLIDVSPWDEAVPARWSKESINGRSAGGAFQRGFFRSFQRRGSESTVLVLCEVDKGRTVRGTRGIAKKIEGMVHHNNSRVGEKPISVVILMSSNHHEVPEKIRTGREVTFILLRGASGEDDARKLETEANSESRKLAVWLTKWADRLERLPLRSAVEVRTVTGVHVQPLLIQEQRTLGREPGRSAGGIEWDQLVNIRDFVATRAAKRPRLAVLGGPGEGKTFLALATVVHGLRELAGSFQKGHREPDQVAFPFFFTASALAKIPVQRYAEAWSSDHPESSALARAAVQREAEELVVAALKESQMEFETTFCEQAIRAAVATGRFFIAIDSLDELEGGEQVERVKRHVELLASIEDGSSILLTCRTSHWEVQRFHGWAIYRLQPLILEQQKKFASNYFKNQPAFKDSFVGKITEAYGMSHLLRMPLFLTLAAILHEKGRFTAQERPHLFMADVLEAFLDNSARHRDVRSPGTDDGTKEGKQKESAKAEDSKPKAWAQGVRKLAALKFISVVAWSLFRERPSANKFEALGQWKAAWQRCEHVKTLALAWHDAPDWAEMLEDLEFFGLIMPEESGEMVFDRQYSLFHRLFFEFLAATGFATIEEEKKKAGFAPEKEAEDAGEDLTFDVLKQGDFKTWDWIESLSDFDWRSGAWDEFFSFLVRLLPEAGQKLGMTDETEATLLKATDPDDVFGLFFGLRCRLVGGLSADTVTKTAQALAKEWLAVWDEEADLALRLFHYRDGRFLVDHREARSLIEDHLSSVTSRSPEKERGQKNDRREDAFEALGHLGLRINDEAIAVIVKRMLRGEAGESDQERAMAARLLGKLGIAEATKALLDNTRLPASLVVVCGCVEGLGYLGEIDVNLEDSVRDCLAKLLRRHANEDVRCRAAQTLGRLRIQGSAEILVRVWSHKRQKRDLQEKNVQEAIAMALAEWPALEAEGNWSQYEFASDIAKAMIKMKGEWERDQTLSTAAWTIAWHGSEVPFLPVPDGRDGIPQKLMPWFEPLLGHPGTLPHDKVPPYQIRLAVLKVVDLTKRFRRQSKSPTPLPENLNIVSQHIFKHLKHEREHEKRPKWIRLFAIAYWRLNHDTGPE